MTSEIQPEDHPQNQPEQTESFAEAILKNIDLSSLPDEGSRECVRQLLNLVESLTGDLRKVQAENQYLREQLKKEPEGPGGPSQGTAMRAIRVATGSAVLGRGAGRATGMEKEDETGPGPGGPGAKGGCGSGDASLRCRV